MSSTVQPLKLQQAINDFLFGLRRNKNAKRDVLPFLIGINYGLCMLDIVKLKKKAILSVKNPRIVEQKTRKTPILYLSSLQDLIQEYIKDLAANTLRKIFSYHYYKKTKDVATLMEIFILSSKTIMKHYIGVNEDKISEDLLNFSLGFCYFFNLILLSYREEHSSLNSLLNNNTLQLKYKRKTDEEIHLRLSLN
ncbi:tyrosine-type recombinase/integrase [Carnobacterium funditum]|uniref:tyrosine-type recombinase/integrase n=1 Tax=Carnobacterium funditum TaxID=2752 RepID=UPI003CCBFF57